MSRIEKKNLASLYINIDYKVVLEFKSKTKHFNVDLPMIPSKKKCRFAYDKYCSTIILDIN